LLIDAGGASSAFAQMRVDDAAAKQPEALPLTSIILYNSGVGFFEHNAQIDGQQQIDLKFSVDDVNDLLKSMVLQDFDGGKVSNVTYASRDPITKTLKTFAIDLTTNPTLADLLRQVRGEKIEIQLVGSKGVIGVIVGLEKRKERVGDKETIEIEYLNLLTDDGLRSFGLNDVVSVKLLNEALDRELRQALMTLTLGHANEKKTVSLKFDGQGKRRVRVGYVQQSPIWKTSYRLVLDDKREPMIQGWALVENTSERDWSNIKLTLVSGRPVSFVMNLYEPLYIPRPVVQLDLFASLRPQVYGQDMAARKAGADAAKAQAVFNRATAAPAAPAAAGEAILFGSNTYFGGTTISGLTSVQLNLGDGVASAASASELGELFQYIIDSPVTLPRQQSAMLPIVQGEIKAKKVSIYNRGVHAKHPLNGIRITNTTGMHLMQGPITVFDDNAYAGDARIEDLAPGGERLASYAMDLDTEVTQESKNGDEQLVSVRIAKGVVITKDKYNRTQTFTVKNSGKADKTLLIEMPYERAWTLVTPKKPDEKTRDMYRFNVDATAGKTVTFDVSEEQIVEEQVAAANLDDRMILVYQKAKNVSEDVKAALGEIVDRKRQLNDLTTSLQQAQQQIDAISQEQTRIRQNMQQLDRMSDLYRRYVTKFTDQETQVEQLRTKMADLQSQIDQKRRELDEFILGLEVS
jgi:hypothetical protein